MNYLKLLSWCVVTVLVFSFTACDNEPIPGGLVVDDGPLTADFGEFVADINGVIFRSDSIDAIRQEDRTLRITAYKPSGESMSITVENSSTSSTFNLVSAPGTLNGAVYRDTSSVNNPWTTSFALGATGTLNITALSPAQQTVTGNFTYKGVRPAVDDSGNPILDGNGDPVVEMIDVFGGFNIIPFTIGLIDDDDGNGNEPVDSFTAMVDGTEFMEETVSVTSSTVSEMPMLTVWAEDANGATLRIDIPEDQGLGTFALESISDGTQLIALYQDGALGASLTSNPGTITITELNSDTGRLSATFSFTGTDPLGLDGTVVEVTEGEFSLMYEPTIDTTPEPFMATIDGEEYIPDSVDVFESTFVDTQIVTIATSLGSQSMSITFPADITVGTYVMSSNLITGNEIVGSYVPDSSGSTVFASDPGTLELTVYELGGMLQGTFSFSAVDQSGGDPTVYEITSGSFFLEFP